MKINNINFGARLDKETFQFLLKARKNGLKTRKMEKCMREICPHKTIFTTLVDNKIEGKPNKGIKIMGIMTGKDYIPILDYKVVDVAPSLSYIGEAYKINQTTVDEITKRLNALKSNSKLKIKAKNPILKDLLKKFGEPV